MNMFLINLFDELNQSRIEGKSMRRLTYGERVKLYRDLNNFSNGEQNLFDWFPLTDTELIELTFEYYCNYAIPANFNL